MVLQRHILLFSFIVIASCHSKNEHISSTDDTTVTSTSTDKVTDTQSAKFIAKEELELNAIKQRENEKEEISKYYGKGYKSGMRLK